MGIYIENMFRDRDLEDSEKAPGCEALDVMSHDCHLYGYVLTPGGKPGDRHPLAVFLHGFPGLTTNHDVEQSLRRMGFVVMNPFCRGAWGSEGYYSFDGIVDDAVAVVEWALSDNITDRLSIDSDRVFIVGHSMGGFAAINAARRLPMLRGCVCLAPYDMPWFFENDRVDEFASLLPEGSCLKQESPTSLFESAKENYKRLAFSQAAEDLKDINLYFIGAEKDAVAPPRDMIEPLYNKLRSLGRETALDYDLIDTNHGFDDKRILLSEKVCTWLRTITER